MMECVVQISLSQGHKRHAIELGLKRLGYKQKSVGGLHFTEKTLMVTWNLHGREKTADLIKSKGGKVIVVENPYIKYDLTKREYLAAALNGHNGSGIIPAQTHYRSTLFLMDLHPWQHNERGHVLVIGQRGIGSSTMKSPTNWEVNTVNAIRSVSDREVRLRLHPAVAETRRVKQRSLDDDLFQAHSVVMWSSNSATEALIKGIPVFYNGPHCVLQKACKRGGIYNLEDPYLGSRSSAFEDLAWSQWSLDDFKSGEAIERLVNVRS